MEYLHSFFDTKIEKPTAVTVGKFDGIHKGHELLNECILSQKTNGLSSVVVTFSNTPRIALEKDDILSLITNEERVFKLEREGVDYLIECPFDNRMMTTEPEDFIYHLVKSLNMKYLVVGSDFRFGHKGIGDVKMLKELSKSYDFELKVIEKIKQDARDISSTYIREELINGNIKLVNDMLGYDYFIWGEVVHGAHLGTKIGIPTINIIPPNNKLVPKYGVYATTVEFDGRKYHGVTNVGNKPTVSKEKHLGIETHILDFNGDIYGKDVKVTFKYFIRDEIKFASVDDLKAQMTKDKNTARMYFNSVISG